MIDNEHITISKYRLERANETLAAGKSLYDTDIYSSANRLYYAIFSAMRAVLALESVDFKKHSAVISYFRQNYIKTGAFDRKYSEMIGVAAQLRTDSDYKDLYMPDRDEIALLIPEAEAFITEVSIYLHLRLTK